MNPTQKPHRYMDIRYNEDEDRQIARIDPDGQMIQAAITNTRKVDLKILKDRNRKHRKRRIATETQATHI